VQRGGECRPRGGLGQGAGVKEEEAGGLAGEKALGSGLAGALAFLKERGELGRPVEWAGRTNDSRDSYFTAAMGGYKDVFTGGRNETQLATDVEVALTKRDEFGRVLTPKEAFRQLCHRFHGIQPSKNTREKRAKQVAKEMDQRRAATGDAEPELLVGARVMQQQTATPYIVLSGTVRPGQIRDGASGYAADEREAAAALTAAALHGGGATPVLGGGQTPLLGLAKVEAMLGVKRPAGGAESMPPPPNKAAKKRK
jgi:U4/U6.U5 tri-snRNP-associated protein 1